jgi:hypothetical protein
MSYMPQAEHKAGVLNLVVYKVTTGDLTVEHKKTSLRNCTRGTLQNSKAGS